MKRLTVSDHDRDVAGYTYVYPVVSRRAGGVSLGVNLNPNNACNWRCVYCQVPGLVRGAAPPIELPTLTRELRALLDEVQSEAWLTRHVDAPFRRIVDVAFSGNGEPTTARPFDEIVAAVLEVLDERGLQGLNKVLISNGSMMQREEVQRGLARLAAAGGEVWFKLDSATAEGRRRVNDTSSSPETARQNLRISAAACRTRLQTCVVAIDGAPPSPRERAAYLELVREELAAGTPIADVLLYGMARPSHQPGAERLSRAPSSWIEAFADDIRALGLAVTVRL
ncbi:MAG: radical SAM protein [Myxococcales bacterium]|nr:radical SAM protein [Myxococcales bacterium]